MYCEGPYVAGRDAADQAGVLAYPSAYALFEVQNHNVWSVFYKLLLQKCM